MPGLASPIGVALVGGGIFAREEHLPAVSACDILSLEAVYSRSKSSAESTARLAAAADDAHRETPVYADELGPGHDYAALLARDGISAVIIALPIMNQGAYIEQALAAGKHVLAEKPVAADVAAGRALIDYYRRVAADKGVTFAVAENFRYCPSYAYAKQEIATLGKVTGFSAKVFFHTAKEGNKWYETAWRKKPEHQGGFVLDAGVHFAAALRLLLGEEAAPATVTAYTAQVQEHLPPLDTVHALVRTRSGAIGTFSIAAGSTLPGSEFGIACERGSVVASSTKVTVLRGVGDGKEETVRAFDYTSGVKEEVQAWAESLVAGKADPLQSPEQALADLELLEKMFRSGEQDGAPQKLEFQ